MAPQSQTQFYRVRMQAMASNRRPTGFHNGCRAVKEDRRGGFGSPPSPAQSSAAKAQPRKEYKKWQLKAASTEEWEGGVEEQKKAAGVKGDDIYVQASLSRCTCHCKALVIAALEVPQRVFQSRYN